VRTTAGSPKSPPTTEKPAERTTDFAHETNCTRPLTIKSLAREKEAKRLQIDGRVRVASGPWGLEEAWWSAAPKERDYWDVELDGGALYRIFHERQSGDWFVDGIYD
jgi:protein ImuB